MVVRNQEKEDNQKDIDKEVGKLIEIFINEKLAEKGITHCSGTYLPPEEGEADLVVEATKGIMLFEMKKKSLTRKTKERIYTPVLYRGVEQPGSSSGS